MAQTWLADPERQFKGSTLADPITGICIAFEFKTLISA
jgi:hypothetical protein